MLMEVAPSSAGQLCLHNEIKAYKLGIGQQPLGSYHDIWDPELSAL